MTPYGPKWIPAGGHIMAHTSGLRLQLRKAGANKRIATVTDSSWIASPAPHSIFLVPFPTEDRVANRLKVANVLRKAMIRGSKMTLSWARANRHIGLEREAKKLLGSAEAALKTRR